MSHRGVRLLASIGAAMVLGVAGIAVLVAGAAGGSRPDWLAEAGLVLVGAAVAVLILPAVLPAHVIKIRKGARPRGRRPVRSEPAVHSDAPLGLPPRDLAG